MAQTRFEGKTAIVTGAGSGIGQATALRLASEGCRVLAVDLNEDGLAEMKAQAGSEAFAGGEVRTLAASVADEASARRIVQDFARETGRLDTLVNMAGILRSGHADQMSFDDFMRCVNVNLGSTFLMCREALPHLEKTRGNIVNAASTSSFFGHPFLTGYAASKGAIAAFTYSLAWEFMKRGVRVNGVAPGSIDTAMFHQTGREMVEGADWQLYEHMTAINGSAPPSAVAGVIAMLASADGAHINGEIVRMDGGVHA